MLTSALRIVEHLSWEEVECLAVACAGRLEDHLLGNIQARDNQTAITAPLAALGRHRAFAADRQP